MPAAFDVPKILAHFGGPVRLEQLATQHGVPAVTSDAARKWRQRGHLSSSSLLSLVDLGLAIRKPFRIDRHLIAAELEE